MLDAHDSPRKKISRMSSQNYLQGSGGLDFICVFFNAKFASLSEASASSPDVLPEGSSGISEPHENYRLAQGTSLGFK